MIFDCDGVVADSEVIALDLLRQTIERAGLALSLDAVGAAFQGRSLSGVRAVLHERFGFELAPERFERMHTELRTAFLQRLRPVAGMAAVVSAVACARCIASSSGTERLANTLALTRMASLFGAAVFSADAVAKGKPAPDLFLHAANMMGHATERSVVIEDSPAGIEAARAAGMRAIGFMGGAHAMGSRYRDSLRDVGAEVVAPDAPALRHALQAIGVPLR